MKINYLGYHEIRDMDVKEAIVHSLTPDAYSYEGKIEKLERHVEKLQEIIARLIEVVIDENKKDQIEAVLGSGYEARFER